jgi:hypothetical protein
MYSVTAAVLCNVIEVNINIPAPGGGGTTGAAQPSDPASGKVLTGDLDSSLASLAQNLSINKGGQASVKLVYLRI